MFLFYIVLAGCLEIILIMMKDESAKIGIFCHNMYTASYKKPSAPGDGTLLLIMIKSNLKFNLT